MKPELEICAYSLESCLSAKNGGADRVELCSSMYEGGTTPSFATVTIARKLTAGIQLYIMIRPRGGDFLYSELEYEQMKSDISCLKNTGIDGVVIGLLTADGDVDMVRTRELVQLAAPLKVTFHRAFDMARDYRKALEDVIACGCHRILTSGGRNTADEATETLRELVALSAGRIRLMAGSGVNTDNVGRLLDTGVDAVHMSGKNTRDGNMKFRNPQVSMGGLPGIPEYGIVFSDEQNIWEIVKKIENRTKTKAV